VEQAAIEDDRDDADLNEGQQEMAEAQPQSVTAPDVTDPAPNERPDIAALRRMVEERNRRVAEAGKTPQIEPHYLTLAERGDPRVAPVTRVNDPDDHVTKPGGGVIPGGHRVA
jgi:hypothetical protein